MSDESTSPTDAQPCTLSAKPSFTELVALLEERKRTTFHLAVMENIPVQVNGVMTFDLGVTVPAGRRYGVAMKPSSGETTIYLGMGLTQEEAEARGKELGTKRAATGDHLWN